MTRSIQDKKTEAMENEAKVAKVEAGGHFFFWLLLGVRLGLRFVCGGRIGRFRLSFPFVPFFPGCIGFLGSGWSGSGVQALWV